MAGKPKRIVLDTNLWISFLITKDFTKLDKLLLSGKYILIFSNELLDEFIEVAKRPKMRKYFSQNDLENILESVHKFAEFVDVKSEVMLCRDKKDNFLLSLCIDGKADYLLTGDADLLLLKKVKKCSIITIKIFFEKLKP
jgi:putative PIN family toxin of toxin-antitoxin system